MDPHFPDLCTNCRRVVSLLPLEKGSLVPILERGVGEPQSRSEQYGELKILDSSRA
jgi:hypothetical protein